MLIVGAGITILLTRKTVGFIAEKIVHLWPLKIWFGDPNKGVMTMNVFIHGTFSSSLVFLDFASAQKDKLENTSYKKSLASVRKNSTFFIEQAMQYKGLWQVVPSLEWDKQGEVKSGAAPMSAICQLFDQRVLKKLMPQKFYTLGWSGLLSQKRRRLEAIRGFNMLQEEVLRLQKEGWQVKVRCFCHSHGGNLALNFAGVAHAAGACDCTNIFFDQYPQGAQIKELFNDLLTRLPSQEVALTKKGQRRWQYYPDRSATWQIDELILLGVPTQLETAFFVHSPFFKRIVSLYSDQDLVQGMDFLTTSRGYSGKRFHHELGLKPGQVKGGALWDGRLLIMNPSNRVVASSQVTEKQNHPTWWQVIFGLKNSVRSSPDPTHRELWSIMPTDSVNSDSVSTTPKNFLQPIPLVCFSGLLAHLAYASGINDLDFRFVWPTGEALTIAVMAHADQETVLAQVQIPNDLLVWIKEQLKPWEREKGSSQEIKALMEKLVRDIDFAQFNK